MALTPHSHSTYQGQNDGRRFALSIGVLATVALLALAAVFGLGGDLLASVIGVGLSQEASADWIAGGAEVMTGVLGAALTVVAIVVELASNRYSHRISEQFFSNTLNRAMLGLLATTTVLCLWVSIALSAGVHSDWFNRFGVWLLFALMSVSVLCLIPYFVYVFSFLRPTEIVRRVQRRGQPEAIWNSKGSTQSKQLSLIGVVNDLNDIASSAIENQDRNIAIGAMAALFDLIEAYRSTEFAAPSGWTTLNVQELQDPDFVALSVDAREQINNTGTWLETKIIRQALILMTRALPGVPEIAHLFTLRTLHLDQLAAKQPELCQVMNRALNSLLRITIRAGDQRTSYYVLAHYRTLASKALQQSNLEWGYESARYLAYYGQLGYAANQPFLLETAAHDLVELICTHTDHATTSNLLELLLELDRPIEDDESGKSMSLLGVRRAQIRLASYLRDREDSEHYLQVIADLAAEQDHLIDRAINMLQREDRDQYWEFTDRGDNFDYLKPELREHLPQIRTDIFGASTAQAEASRPPT